MKRLLSLLCFLFLSIPLFTVEIEQWTSPSGYPVEIRYRSFQPGEILILTLKSPKVQKAQIRFEDRKFEMRGIKNRSELQAFVGLDLGIKPGAYPVKIFILNSAGRWEAFERIITIASREFPVKKLWVEEQFVTPPPSMRERIKRESEILEAIYSRFSLEWLGEGRFIIPVEGKNFANFGERRIYNNQPRSSHGGVDISAPAGTPVKASNSGEVVLASNLYFSGKTVIIDHGLGLFTLYLHLSKFLVKRGNMVRKGEIVGEVGATGRVTGPHLHWGVKISRSRIDPSSLLSFPFD